MENVGLVANLIGSKRRKLSLIQIEQAQNFAPTHFIVNKNTFMESQAKTRKEIADQYGINVKTLSRWCVKHNIPLEKRDRVPPKIVQQIYDQFGCPIMPENGQK